MARLGLVRRAQRRFACRAYRARPKLRHTRTELVGGVLVVYDHQISTARPSLASRVKG